MNTIQGSFGFDNSPLVTAMNEAPNIAARGARGVQAQFESIFKRSPHMRAERALSGFLSGIAAGDLGGAIQSLTGRMTGLGLAVGVAIGAGVEIFRKFQEQIHESEAASKALGLTLAFSGNIRGPEQLAERFKLVSKQVDELVEKSGTLGAKLGRFFNSPGSLIATPGKLPGNPQAEIIAGLKEEGNLLQQNAVAREKEFGFKKSAITAGETQASIAKAYYEVTRKQSAIDEELGRFKIDAIEKAKTLTDEQRKVVFNETIPNAVKAAESRKNIIREEAAFELSEGKKKLEIQNQSLAVEEKMQGLIKKGLKPGDQQKVRTGLELESLDKQIANETNPDVKRKLQIARGQKENELQSFAKPEEGANPYQFGTISAREFERSQESEKFNSQFASFGMTQEKKDLKAPARQNSTVVAALEKVDKTIKDTMKEYWGDGK